MVSQSKAQSGMAVAETGSQQAPAISGDVGYGELVLHLQPGGDGIAGSFDPDSAVPQTEPDYKMEGEPVAMESVTLTQDSGSRKASKKKKPTIEVEGGFSY